MKKPIITAIVIVLALLLAAGLTCWKNLQPSASPVGTWILYEGGYVAPEVLTFNADGSGVAYALSVAYQDDNLKDVKIPRKYLEQEEQFRWYIENGMLTFNYDSGKQQSLAISFDTAAAVRVLSLGDGFASGGWIPAKLID